MQLLLEKERKKNEDWTDNSPQIALVTKRGSVLAQPEAALYARVRILV